MRAGGAGRNRRRAIVGPSAPLSASCAEAPSLSGSRAIPVNQKAVTRSAERQCCAIRSLRRRVRAQKSREWRNAMLVRGAAGSIAIFLLAGSAALAAGRAARRRFGAIPGSPRRNASSGGSRRAGFRRFSRVPAISHLACAAGRLFRDHAASSRRMARHPLEAERSRHQCLDHRRRRSGDELLRRRPPHTPKKPGKSPCRPNSTCKRAWVSKAPRSWSRWWIAGAGTPPRTRASRRCNCSTKSTGAATSSAWSNSPGIKSGSTAGSKPPPAGWRSATSSSPTLATSSI